MTTNHTPGPWVQYGISVRAADNEATIATVQANYGEHHSNFGSADEINRHEQVANAHLIAAAPELLAELHEQDFFIGVLIATIPLSEKDAHRRIAMRREAVRSAIAKALGN